MNTIIALAIVWHLALAALVGWLWWSRRQIQPAPDRRDPVAEPAAPRPPRPRHDIGAGKLVTAIFRSHTVFPKSASEWRGTAGELRAALVAPLSFVPDDLKQILPPPAALARRLVSMSDSTGHFLEIQVEQLHDDPEQIKFRLSLNPRVIQ